MQDIGEIEPFFVAEFFDELEKEWHLKVNNDKIHIVTFNKCILNPRLTTGWNQLIDTYQLKSYHKIRFIYLGDNFFNVSLDFTKVNSNIFPPFHSLSTAPKFHREFQVVLLQNMATYTSLVNINLYIYLLIFTIL
jgi:hypothetical protein